MNRSLLAELSMQAFDATAAVTGAGTGDIRVRRVRFISGEASPRMFEQHGC